MSQIYDNWERLVKATLRREELRRLCREDSLSSDFSSSFSSSSSESSRSFFEPEDSPSPNTGILSSFSYRQIARATDRFSNQNLIKQGHSGDLFLGSLPTQFPDHVVVKRINFKVVGRKPLALELAFLSRVDSNNHPRFVQLLGHCLDGNENEKFLVYRYLPQRDLSNSLFFKEDNVDNSLSSLDWITRWKIARGVAEALSFLHHECDPPLVHGDVQASSILLDHNFEVRLGSLSQVSAERIQKDKFTFTWKSKKATSGTTLKTICAYDVYCLGKVLLELVTGKLGISSSTDADLKVFLEATLLNISIYDMGLLTNIVDPSLIIDEDLLEEVWAMAIIARSCLNPQPTRRPIIKHVLKALENPTQVVRDDNTTQSKASNQAGRD
ncbi:probable LRR receptor-like serine/threonine-protein kinase at2g16250 [Phtheirospermum japonicum]|uniref:Probable LRR receptor-like serine/threonine-protein kinase at2g16250 n=1 Tax=Phtheirospermum japonicum TaxID=374723 RepID=A0A830CPS8_9LAMI|nr:probable LRR receptor-like serine/threonine-protein kinase at2g16250 [Phtheirospermum japonicum]